jgi:hypothetical protein
MTQKSRKPWKSENITRVTFSDRRKILLITLLGCFPVESSTGCREKHSWGNHPVTNFLQPCNFFYTPRHYPSKQKQGSGKKSGFLPKQPSKVSSIVTVSGRGVGEIKNPHRINDEGLGEGEN